MIPRTRPNRLLMGLIENDPDDYQRGLEIEREKTVDDGDFDDDQETQNQKETLTAKETI